MICIITTQQYVLTFIYPAAIGMSLEMNFKGELTSILISVEK